MKTRYLSPLSAPFTLSTNPSWKSTPPTSASKSIPRVLLAVALLLPCTQAPGLAQLTLENEHRIDLTDLGFSYTSTDNFGSALAVGDFDGDGIDDAAIGLPGRQVSTQSNAGAVVVIYGTGTGLGQPGARAPLLITQTATTDETSETDDAFGFALTAADFNGSGHDDLVVGVPFEDFSHSRGGTWTDGGVVHVFWGSDTGLAATSSDILYPDDYSCSENYGDGLDFGYSLAARDRDLDPYEDLVIGMPGATLADPFDFFDTDDDGGALLMLTGNLASGLTGGLCWSPDEELSPGSRFATALALGDTNDGGSGNEIVAGSPFADLFPQVDDDEGGAFQYFVSGPFPQYGTQDGDQLGAALAMGDFRGVGYDQVLIGIPESSAAGPDTSGQVRLIDAAGPDPTFVQGSGSVLEAAEPFDRFGQVLGSGDFNADGIDDAVFGVPGENLDDDGDNELDAGAVHVQYGHSDGLDSGAGQLFHWDEGFVGWSAIDGDRFGSAVAAGDFNGDGVHDLLIGASHALVGVSGDGMVQVIYGQDASLLFKDGFETGNTSSWAP